MKHVDNKISCRQPSPGILEYSVLIASNAESAGLCPFKNEGK